MVVDASLYSNSPSTLLPHTLFSYQFLVSRTHESALLIISNPVSSTRLSRTSIIWLHHTSAALHRTMHSIWHAYYPNIGKVPLPLSVWLSKLHFSRPSQLTKKTLLILCLVDPTRIWAPGKQPFRILYLPLYHASSTELGMWQRITRFLLPFPLGNLEHRFYIVN